MFERTTFPSHLCTQQSEDARIQESTVPFLCVIRDTRFPESVTVEVLYPFIYPTNLFGWADKNGIVRATAAVVAWKQLESPNVDWTQVFPSHVEK